MHCFNFFIEKEGKLCSNDIPWRIRENGPWKTEPFSNFHVNFPTVTIYIQNCVPDFSLYNDDFHSFRWPQNPVELYRGALEPPRGVKGFTCNMSRHELYIMYTPILYSTYNTIFIPKLSKQSPPENCQYLNVQHILGFNQWWPWASYF